MSRSSDYLHGPTPRRPGTFSLTPISTDTSGGANSDVSPSEGPSEPSTPDVRDPASEAYNTLGREQSRDSSNPPQKSRSILNLTSSTLFGIYNHSGFDSNRDEPPTPFGAGSLTPAPGTGSQTPARSGSFDFRPRNGGPVFSEELLKERAKINIERKRERRKSELQQQSASWRRRSTASRAMFVLLRTVLLFGFGVAYGALISHLHDKENIAPVKVDRINRRSWYYTIFWGSMGIALGSLLPWFDGPWQHNASPFDGLDTDDSKESSSFDNEDELDSPDNKTLRATLGAEWNPLVRSIGAFVGIAFAIRKLAWQSTLQVSLTLALVNPCLWYMIDRTKGGFCLAALTGIAGAAILLAINPGWVPSPSVPVSAAAATQSATVWGLLKDIANPPPPVSERLLEPDLVLGLVSYESIGVATWISSVLFCSCIFFGNIGRRLSLDRI